MKIPYYYKPLLFVLLYIDRSSLCIDRLLYPRKTNGDSLTDMLVSADESSAYQPDDKGSFPIHVAAAEGKLGAINILLNESLKCANLCNARGRTFLHVAVEKVEIDYLNNEGLTPLDISLRLKPKGIHHISNQQIWITAALKLSNAKLGNPRVNDGEEKCVREKVRKKGDSESEEDKKEDHEQEDLKTLTESTQIRAVCSTLIATVAFAAAFTLPGGSPAVDYRIRFTHLNWADRLVWLSIRCLLAAFALGLYVVLAPVAHKTAFIVCLMCSAMG
ncbi:hypothetical protein E2562_027587 [Oryza meyeriana var. granulata]|uniref:PGG domain-containing protein n=1 Tax=Oryza meyeriana var. granulata TaxID=110450 RepID=A0A6G1DNZ0_9ORYZ|nr:hypothetical protein E2562_027587 [Oryza meyeriana var. granulata]